MKFEKTTEKIIGAAYTVYNKMGFGYLESVYEKCLAIELRKTGLLIQLQHPITVNYESHVVGNFIADMVVENIVIVELKSVKGIVKAHEVQLVNYLVATQCPLGLIINFSPTKVEVKRKVRSLNSRDSD